MLTAMQDDRSQREESNKQKLYEYCLDEFARFAGVEWKEEWEDSVRDHFEQWNKLEELAGRHLGAIRGALRKAIREVRDAGEVVGPCDEFGTPLHLAKAEAEGEGVGAGRFYESRFRELLEVLGDNIYFANSTPKKRDRPNSCRTFLVMQLLEATCGERTLLPEELVALCLRLTDERANAGGHITTKEIAVVSVLCGNMPNIDDMATDTEPSNLLYAEERNIIRAYGSVLRSEKKIAVWLAVAGFDIPPPNKGCASQ